MASYKKHILGYLFFITILLYALTYYRSLQVNLEFLALGVSIGIFYTLLPDIDSPSSKLRGIMAKLSLASLLCCLSGYLYFKDMKLIYLSLGVTFFLYILWFSRHRQVFHSPLTGTFLSLPWYVVNPYFFAFAISGFLSHLVIDGELWE